MKLLLKNQEAKLLANAKATAEAEGEDLGHYPVVKFFNPCGAATWLISEMDEDGIMFGLCDLGFGCPELGSVSFEELKSIKLPFGLTIERDMHWEADKSLTEYADEARSLGRIAA
jgi:hypothetical protein